MDKDKLQGLIVGMGSDWAAFISKILNRESLYYPTDVVPIDKALQELSDIVFADDISNPPQKDK